MYQAELKDGKIVVENEPEEVFNIGGYGRMKKEKLLLEPAEAMNLMQRDKLKVVKEEEELGEESFTEKPAIWWRTSMRSCSFTRT